MATKNIWVFGCSHEVKDVSKGYHSLQSAIQDALGPMGGFDIALGLGDHDASQGLPDAAAGAIVQAEYSPLNATQRARFYEVSGNHDRGGPYENSTAWFEAYIDPMGENTVTSGLDATLRTYPVVGTTERYYVDMGNIRILMMSDVNRPITPGRGVYGGDPGGVISEDTWLWWKDQVDTNHASKILVTAHHYLPRETTIATGDYEGVQWDSTNKRWKSWIHGTGRNPRHVSRLSYVGEIEGAPHFENYMAAHPGRVAVWFGAHSHLKPGQTINSRGFVEEKWGTTFVQAGALTKHHGMTGELYPRSRMLIVKDGQQTATMRHYFHTNSDFTAKGFWPNDHTIDLGKQVQL